MESVNNQVQTGYLKEGYFADILNRILTDDRLGRQNAYTLMDALMGGHFDDVELASILTALRIQNIGFEELAGLSEAMLDSAVQINCNKQGPLIDIVGTGGAKFKTFNVSTTSSFVLPLFGVNVAKHGNRSSTSKSGSADLLESLGVNINMPPSIAERCLDKIGLTFMFAPTFHPSMKNVVPMRKRLKIRTIFNILGPLTNPCRVKRQLTGVFDPRLLLPIAKSLQERNFDRVSLVYNDLGCDEIVQYGKTTVYELHNNRIEKYTVKAEDFGIPECNPKDIVNLSADKAARRCIDILSGNLSSPLSDFVAINSAMALRVAGIETDLVEGTAMVKEKLRSGDAIEILRKFVELSEGDIRHFQGIVS